MCMHWRAHLSPVLCVLVSRTPACHLRVRELTAVPTVRHGADVITCRALDCVGPFVSLVSALYGNGGFRLCLV